MGLQMYHAKSEHKEILADLLEYCYDYPAPALHHLKDDFADIADEHYVGEMEGKVVVALRNIPLSQNIRGSFKSMGGIANVVSAPEYRRRRFVNELMNYSFSDLKYSYGAGLRFLFNKKEKVNLRVDFGFGNNGSKGIYLAIEEAF